MVAAMIMVLTFVFGIVPATLLLVYFVIALGAVGFAAVFVSIWLVDVRALLTSLFEVAVAAGAVYGYIALYYAAGDMVTPKVARWLLAGIVATAGGAILIGNTAFGYSALKGWYLFWSPTVVAAAHLVRFSARTKQRHANV
jgi:hypothetical protein